MAYLHVEHDYDIVSFTEGRVPSAEHLAECFPYHRWASPIRSADVPSDAEERKAWWLALHCTQSASRHGYRSDRPLEVWLMSTGPSTDGRFSAWFKEQPEDYRLIIKRIRLPQNGPDFFVMPGVYDRLGMKTRRHQSRAMNGPMYEFLSDVQWASQNEPATLDSLFRDTGHLYARATGPPFRQNR